MTEVTRKRLLEVRSFTDLWDRIKLPPRLEQGNPANLERQRILQTAFHQWRVARFTAKGRAKHETGCKYCGDDFEWKHDV